MSNHCRRCGDRFDKAELLPDGEGGHHCMCCDAELEEERNARQLVRTGMSRAALTGLTPLALAGFTSLLVFPENLGCCQVSFSRASDHFGVLLLALLAAIWSVYGTHWGWTAIQRAHGHGKHSLRAVLEPRARWHLAASGGSAILAGLAGILLAIACILGIDCLRGQPGATARRRAKSEERSTARLPPRWPRC